MSDGRLITPESWPTVGTFITNKSPDPIKRTVVHMTEIPLHDIHGGWFDLESVSVVRFCPHVKRRHYREPTNHYLVGWRKHEESPLCTFVNTYSMYAWLKAWRKVNL